MGDAAWWQRRMRRQRFHHAISIDVVLIVVNHLMVMVDGWWIGKIMSGARQRVGIGTADRPTLTEATRGISALIDGQTIR